MRAARRRRWRRGGRWSRPPVVSRTSMARPASAARSRARARSSAVSGLVEVEEPAGPHGLEPGGVEAGFGHQGAGARREVGDVDVHDLVGGHGVADEDRVGDVAGDVHVAGLVGEQQGARRLFVGVEVRGSRGARAWRRTPGRNRGCVFSSMGRPEHGVVEQALPAGDLGVRRVDGDVERHDPGAGGEGGDRLDVGLPLASPRRR